MSMVEVKVPDIGDFKEVEVIELMVKPGDTITVDQSLITVESDKASMEIPSSHAGVVKELKVKIGDKVAEGTPLLTLETEGAAAPAPAPAAAAAAAAPAPVATASVPASPPPAPNLTLVESKPVPTAALEPRDENGFKPHASPSVRKFSRELGVDLVRLKGTG
ncbi:MAG: biotin/lipoyl-containing protein, partial [Bacillota bacterium]